MESDSKKINSISVFFPCHNEAGNVETLVQKTCQVLRKLTDDYEIIIVDDGSSDGTAEIADRLSNQMQTVRVIHHENNLGYGAALQSGFKAASKELVFYTDGDGQFDIAEIEVTLPLIKEYDIISCFRVHRQEGFIRKLNGWCWTKLVCFLFSLNLKDIDCGFKLFKRKIFDNIEMLSTGALIDTEILARAAKKGYTITQVGVRHYPRKEGVSSGANLKVILRAFKELIRLRRQILGGVE